MSMALEVGQNAPDFELRDQHGQDVTLGSFAGQKAVVLVFYPFAFSRVCTGELSDLRDRLSDFVTDDVQLLAMSCDPMFTLRVFADSDDLKFPLLSDFWPHGAVSRAYGVFDEEKGCSTRSTFIVDKDGVLRWSVHNPMGEARDLEEYLRVLDGLRG
jgi:peroxiredoxin